MSCREQHVTQWREGIKIKTYHVNDYGRTEEVECDDDDDDDD
jgi:hypothetical protein